VASSLGANFCLTLPLFLCAGRHPPEPTDTAIYPRAPVAVVPRSSSRRHFRSLKDVVTVLPSVRLSRRPSVVSCLHTPVKPLHHHLLTVAQQTEPHPSFLSAKRVTRCTSAASTLLSASIGWPLPITGVVPPAPPWSAPSVSAPVPRRRSALGHRQRRLAWPWALTCAGRPTSLSGFEPQ
jgi:hypothetical protein